MHIAAKPFQKKNGPLAFQFQLLSCFPPHNCTARVVPLQLGWPYVQDYGLPISAAFCALAQKHSHSFMGLINSNTLGGEFELAGKAVKDPPGAVKFRKALFFFSKFPRMGNHAAT
jgi:hypothetical protein